MLTDFVKHLEKTRGDIAKDLVKRLKAYLTMSAETADSPTAYRGRRDVGLDGMPMGQDEGISMLDGLGFKNSNTPFLPCNHVQTNHTPHMPGTVIGI